MKYNVESSEQTQIEKGAAMHEYLMPMLECPACHEKLDRTIEKRNKDHIERAQARCVSCGALYPVQEGIAIFLTPDLPRHDLWEETGSGLTAYLHEHPQIERKLLETSPEDLPPADQFFLAMVLEEGGNYAQARSVADLAHVGVYTKEYQDCFKSQIGYVKELVSSRRDPIDRIADPDDSCRHAG